MTGRSPPGGRRRRRPATRPHDACRSCSTRKAGGRASSRRTSPWTPRIFSCASSWASGPRPRRSTRRGGSALTSGPTAPGPTSSRGPAELSTTVEAYVALRLAGDDPAMPAHASGGGAHSRGPGASGRTRVFTRIWLALFGLWSWDELPVLPPELVLPALVGPAQHLRLRVLGPPDGGALTVVGAHRPVRPMPIDLTSCEVPDPGPRRRPSLGTWGGWFAGLDSLLHRYERRPVRCAAPPCPAPGRAVDRPAPGGRRVLGRHPASMGLLAHGPEPAGLRARPPRHRGRAGRASTASSSTTAMGRRLEACQSPVWDTALAGDRPGRRGSARRGPCAAPSGHVAGRRGDHRGRRLERAPTRPRPGRLGLRVRQRPLPRHRRHRRGGPGPRRRVSVDDRGSARAGSDLDPRHAVPRRRLGGLRRRQHPDRSAASCPSATSASSSTRRAPTSPPTWSRCWPRSGAGGRPSTGVSRGCWTRRRPTARGSAAGGPTTSTAPGPRCRPWWPPASTAGHPAVRRRRRLARARTRTPTAAGARTCAPTTTPSSAGRGASTASQTAWALLALLAAGAGTDPDGAIDRGVDFLSTPSGRTAPGTSPSSPAPASPATSTSTTTSTGWCSRSPPWAATCTATGPWLTWSWWPPCGSRRWRWAARSR